MSDKNSFGIVLTQNAFSLFLTATCMCVFELLFLYLVVFPDIGRTLDTLAKSAIAVPVDFPGVDHVRVVVSALEQREKKRLASINQGTKQFGVLLVMLLVAACIAIAVVMNRKKISPSLPLQSTAATVLVLVLFQIWFYHNTKRDFRFASDDELYTMVLKELRCAPE